MGPNPTDRAKSGSKHHILTDARGTPLVTILTGANEHDVTQLLPMVDRVPAIGGSIGAPLRKPVQLLADRGYDSEPHREQLRQHGIEPVIAKRNTEHGSGLGTLRYYVEQTIGLLHQFRRLRTRFDCNAGVHQAFMTFGCAMICWRRVRHRYF